MLTIVPAGSVPNDASGGSLLDEIVRDGALGHVGSGVAGRGRRLHRAVRRPSRTPTATGWWSATVPTPSGR